MAQWHYSCQPSKADTTGYQSSFWIGTGDACGDSRDGVAGCNSCLCHFLPQTEIQVQRTKGIFPGVEVLMWDNATCLVISRMPTSDSSWMYPGVTGLSNVLTKPNGDRRCLYSWGYRKKAEVKKMDKCYDSCHDCGTKEGSLYQDLKLDGNWRCYDCKKKVEVTKDAKETI